MIWNPGCDEVNGEVMNICFESAGPAYTKSEK